MNYFISLLICYDADLLNTKQGVNRIIVRFPSLFQWHVNQYFRKHDGYPLYSLLYWLICSLIHLTYFSLLISATVTNLQQKSEALQTANTLMKEDLAIAKNNILQLQQENSRLTNEKSVLEEQIQKHVQVNMMFYL